MLFSIALAPGVLDPPAAHPPPLSRALLGLLGAVTQNGVIVAPEIASLKACLMNIAANAQGSNADSLRGVCEIVRNNIKKYAVSACDRAKISGVGNPYAACIDASRWGQCDGFVVLDEGEKQRCIDAGAPSDRILLLEDFVGSPLDIRRTEWRSAQRLDELGLDTCVEVVGRSIKYASKVVIVDKMIGASMKTRDGQKDTPFHRASRAAIHLAGARFLVHAWRSHSPLAPQARLNLEVVTIAGTAGAAAGPVDGDDTRRAIETAIESLGLQELVGQLTITLKQDDDRIFNDRLLVASRRTWGIHHGFDDFGRLMQATTETKKQTKRKPTRIEPSSEALATTYRDIASLRSA